MLGSTSRSGSKGRFRWFRSTISSVRCTRSHERGRTGSRRRLARPETRRRRERSSMRMHGGTRLRSGSRRPSTRRPTPWRRSTRSLQPANPSVSGSTTRSMSEEPLTRIVVYSRDGKRDLSEMLPLVEDLGLRVIEEIPTSLLRGERHGRPVCARLRRSRLRRPSASMSPTAALAWRQR